MEANGYSNFSVYDQQWQALHMAAVATCIGRSPHGGHGPAHNTVYPRTHGHTCTEVCKATNYYTICDVSLSMMGYMGRVKGTNQEAGIYYNYQCDSTGHSMMIHEETTTDARIAMERYYIGYCCCRNP